MVAGSDGTLAAADAGVRGGVDRVGGSDGGARPARYRDRGGDGPLAGDATVVPGRVHDGYPARSGDAASARAVWAEGLRRPRGRNWTRRCCLAWTRYRLGRVGELPVRLAGDPPARLLLVRGPYWRQRPPLRPGRSGSRNHGGAGGIRCVLAQHARRRR